MRTPFLGPAYVSRSLNLADQQLINLFAEVVETKSGKDIGAFYMAPGLDLVATVGPGPIRAMRYVAHQNIAYIVSGPNVYTLDTSYASNGIGTMATSTGPVSIIDNENQIAIFDGLNGYWAASPPGLLNAIALPFAGPVSAAYQDGFGVVNVAGTQQWFQSNLGDFSLWDALNFGAAAGAPDDIVAIVGLHREMWLIKQFTTEIWINAGLNGFVFEQLQGIFIEGGTPAPYSPAVVGEGICWLAQNRSGNISVVMSEGYRVKDISTVALDHALQSYSTVADAIGYSYAQDGHQFYVLALPTADVTWVYDVTTSRLAGVPMWHQRASFANGVFSRHWSNCGIYFNGRFIVGDYRNGNIYAYDLDQPLDNGAQRKWVRSWRALPKPSEDVQQFNFMRIDMETGGAPAPPGPPPPQVMLRWSDDGGHNWTQPLFARAKELGVTGKRVMFRRLGSTRRSSGLDRIFELSSSDQFKVALIGAEIG